MRLGGPKNRRRISGTGNGQGKDGYGVTNFHKYHNKHTRHDPWLGPWIELSRICVHISTEAEIPPELAKEEQNNTAKQARREHMKVAVMGAKIFWISRFHPPDPIDWPANPPEEIEAIFFSGGCTSHPVRGGRLYKRRRVIARKRKYRSGSTGSSACINSLLFFISISFCLLCLRTSSCLVQYQVLSISSASDYIYVRIAAALSEVIYAFLDSVSTYSMKIIPEYFSSRHASRFRHAAFFADSLPL